MAAVTVPRSIAPHEPSRVPIACPLGDWEGSMALEGENTFRWRARSALRDHLYSKHPGLSVREHSLLADRAADDAEARTFFNIPDAH